MMSTTTSMETAVMETFTKTLLSMMMLLLLMIVQKREATIFMT